MNVIALRQKLLEKHVRVKDLKVVLGISNSALQRKLSGKTEFSRCEVKKIIDYLELQNDEAMFIFFNRKVS